MKKWFEWFVRVVFVVFFVFSLMGCGAKRVGPGYVGIKVNMAGGQRGVQDYPIVTGWVFYLPWATSIVEYPTFMQTATWTKSPTSGRKGVNDEICWDTKDQLHVCADINVSYMLLQAQVPHFYVQFRSDDLDNFTHGYLHNVAMDSFQNIGSKYTFDEVNGEHKEDVLKQVKIRLVQDVLPYGVDIKQFGLLSNIRPPDSVKDAINAKIKATQDAQAAENKVRESIALANQAKEKAKGEAAANQILTASITPQLIQWRQLEITQQAVSRWNGQRPMVEGLNSGGLLLNINPK